jgi:hypothetical protein
MLSLVQELLDSTTPYLSVPPLTPMLVLQHSRHIRATDSGTRPQLENVSFVEVE